MTDATLLQSDALKEAVAIIGKRLQEGNTALTADYSKEDLHLLYSLGHTFYSARDLVKAEEIFRRLVVIAPLELPYWRALASTLQMQKKHEEAIISWSMCCLLDESNPLWHFHAAECLHALGEDKQSAEALLAAKERAREEKILNQIALLEKELT